MRGPVGRRADEGGRRERPKKPDGTEQSHTEPQAGDGGSSDSGAHFRSRVSFEFTLRARDMSYEQAAESHTREPAGGTDGSSDEDGGTDGEGDGVEQVRASLRLECISRSVEWYLSHAHCCFMGFADRNAHRRHASNVARMTREKIPCRCGNPNKYDLQRRRPLVPGVSTVQEPRADAEPNAVAAIPPVAGAVPVAKASAGNVPDAERVDTGPEPAKAAAMPAAPKPPNAPVRVKKNRASVRSEPMPSCVTVRRGTYTCCVS